MSDRPSTKPAVECSRDPLAVVARAQAALELQDLVGRLSPIFPGTWPPAGEQNAVIYAYNGQTLPAGMERNALSSPFARVEISLSDPSAVPRVVRLDVRTLGVWLVNKTRATPEIMDRAAAPMLEAICARKLPPPEDAVQLRANYREWARIHTLVSQEMRRLLPSFFSWVEEND